MHKYELTPKYDSRKSFYGKATVTVNDRGDSVLQSYNTNVAMITESGDFVRLWDGYSATTMRHVNEFLLQAGFPANETGKKFWDACPVRRFSWVDFYLTEAV